MSRVQDASNYFTKQNKITHSSQGAQADADAAILMLMLTLDADGVADVNSDADC